MKINVYLQNNIKYSLGYKGLHCVFLLEYYSKMNKQLNT